MKLFAPFLIMLLAFSLSMQDLVAQEEQVAFSAGIFEINKFQRATYNVLDKYKEDFEKARLLRSESGEYQVEVSYFKRGRSWTEKYAMSATELAELRAQLTNMPAQSETSPKGEVKGNGRYGLIASATFHSISQGVLMSYATSRERFVEFPGGGGYYSTERSRFGRFFPYLYTAGTFAGTMILTSNKNINPAAANAHFFGSGIGIAHGAGLITMLRGEESFKNYQADLAIMGLSSVTEGWLLYSLAKKRNINYAHSKAWNTGNLWGAVNGMFLSFLTIGDDMEGDVALRLLGTGVVGGSVGGIFLTDHLQKTYPRSSGDFTALNSMAAATTIFGSGLFEHAENGFSAGMIGLLNSGSGLVLGYLATNKTNFTPLEGALIGLGTGVGSLFGSGLLILTDVDSAFGVTAMIGGGMLAGWAATYFYFKSDNKKSSRDKKLGGQLNFGINPNGLAMLRSNPANQYRALTSPRGMDMMGLRLSF
jgi:hypothetical protein